MKFFSIFRKNRAIKRYLRKLPALLKKDYGSSKEYTPMQVKRTAERYGLGVVYICYGIAMFSGRIPFDVYHQETGEECNFESMRMELGDNYFHGNSNFDAGSSTYAVSDIGNDGGGTDFSGGMDGGSD